MGGSSLVDSLTRHVDIGHSLSCADCAGVPRTAGFSDDDTVQSCFESPRLLSQRQLRTRSNEPQFPGRQSRARTPTAAFNGTKTLGGSRGISIRPHPPPPSTNSDPKQLQTKPALQPLAVGNPSVQRKTGCGLARIPQPGTAGLHGDDTAIKDSKSPNRHPLRKPPPHVWPRRMPM